MSVESTFMPVSRVDGEMPNVATCGARAEGEDHKSHLVANWARLDALRSFKYSRVAATVSPRHIQALAFNEHHLWPQQSSRPSDPQPRPTKAL